MGPLLASAPGLVIDSREGYLFTVSLSDGGSRMSLDSCRAVLLLEVRASHPTGSGGDAVQSLLAETRLQLEAPASGRQWTQSSGSALSGRVALADASEAFAIVHRLRTDLRSDPSRPRAKLIVGLARGDELEASRLAGDAFRSLGRKKGRYTRALTADPETNAVLDAFCHTLDALHSGWTDAQWQAIHRRDGGRTLQEIGEELDIAYQNVSKRLIAARYSLYQDVLAAAGLVFTRAGE